MDFIKTRKIWFACSWLLIAASIAVMLFNQFSQSRIFNFGIDFTGGTALIVRFAQPVELEDLRAVLPEAAIATLEKDFVVKIGDASAEGRQAAQAALDTLGANQILDAESVGPSIGTELRQKAFLLTILVLSAMLIYITFRFEFWTGLAAVLCLAHDVVITLGLVALLQLNFDSALVAAILTIVGYSINDTIIIFDRIREDLKVKEFAGDPFPVLANRSLHSVLGRCINTNMTTIVMVLAVYLFGGSSIKDFALTLLLGFVVGAYSSIFVATPLYAALRKFQE